MRVGDLTLDGVRDGTQLLDYRTLWPTRSEAELVFDPALAPLHDGMVAIDIGAFLVRSGDRVILVDAGSGPAIPSEQMPVLSEDEPLPEFLAYYRRSGRGEDRAASAFGALARAVVQHGELLTNLASMGVRPEDVTDVVLTHLHHDHVGWVSVEGAATFPRATYHCDERDAEFFVGPDAAHEVVARIFWGAVSAHERLSPVLERMKLWSDDVAIAPGVSIRRTPGHTPGSSVVVLSSGPERALILGDVVHCPLELVDDEWHAMVDVDPVTAQRTRDALFREIDGGTVLGAPHFPGLEFGRIVPGERAQRWVPMS